MLRIMDMHVLPWIKVYTRQPDGQLLTGLDLVANASQIVDFSEVFDRLRQPVFEPAF
ncbi:hypothetical protein [Spirosoma pollinicola]|uniref:hypothetical protein n=1 Tax=Spirosoma pollinicola TaxID=2057025 RepID=UPI0012FE0752|nr:hypothetical protein [Spirosoma pollinicola]